MQQVVISVCAWCQRYKGWKVYEVRDGNVPVIVSDGICPDCAKRNFMQVPGLGLVRLADEEQIEAGKREELGE